MLDSYLIYTMCYLKCIPFSETLHRDIILMLKHNHNNVLLYSVVALVDILLNYVLLYRAYFMVMVFNFPDRSTPYVVLADPRQP